MKRWPRIFTVTAGGLLATLLVLLGSLRRRRLGQPQAGGSASVAAGRGPAPPQPEDVQVMDEPPSRHSDNRFRWRFSHSVFAAALGIILLLVVAADLSLRGTRRPAVDPRWHIAGSDVQRGRQAFIAYGCGACHHQPDARGATGRVGPKLAGLRDQVYLAGRLPNVPENLIAWIRSPQHIEPQTAMPNLNVTESDARDIAAFLYHNAGE